MMSRKDFQFLGSNLVIALHCNTIPINRPPLPPYPEPEDGENDGILYPDDSGDDAQPFSNRYYDD